MEDQNKAWGNTYLILFNKTAGPELYSQYLLKCIMYYLLRYCKKSDKAGGTVLQKRFSRISGQNPRQIHVQIASRNFFLKLNFFTDIFKGFAPS